MSTPQPPQEPLEPPPWTEEADPTQEEAHSPAEPIHQLRALLYGPWPTGITSIHYPRGWGKTVAIERLRDALELPHEFTTTSALDGFPPSAEDGTTQNDQE